MKNLFCLVSILSFAILLTSFNYDNKKKRYLVSDIPEGLTEGAVAVVREHTEEFRIIGPSKARSKIKHVVTVLNRHGAEHGVFIEWYNDLRSIFVERINIYNAQGKLVIAEDITGVEDFSSYSDYSLYDNSRIQRYIPPIKVFPYTVEIIYTFKYNGLINYPVWQPVSGYDLAVEKSEFTIETSPDISFRYSTSNYDDNPLLTADNKSEIYKWRLENYCAIKQESNSPEIGELTPIVYTAPDIFSIEGYSGSMESWNSFGLWTNSLLAERDNLSDIRAIQILNLTEGLTDKVQIIKTIYEYVQSKTRYVSIQEG